MRHKILLVLLFLLPLALPLLAGESNETKKSPFSFLTGESGEKVELPTHEIHFTGQENFDEGDLQDAMSVDAKSMFQFWKEDKPTIKDKLIPTLEDSLRAFYDSEGYYDATFSIKTTKTTVNVTINEGEPVKIKEIDIICDCNVTQHIKLEKGEIFRATDFIKMKSDIVQQLLKEGYCSYDLDTKAYVDLDKHEADIKIVLERGGVCTFGKVSVSGLETIDDGVVISRIRAREGERFSTERIQESYDALYALDAFDSVAVKYDRKFYNVVPIDFLGSEMSKPYYFLGGVGYDTNVGAGVNAEIIRKNFMGNAKKLRLRLGYSEIEQLAEISLFTPALFSISDYYFDLATKIGYSNLEYTGFMEEKLYAQAFLAYTNEKLSLNAGFSIENIDISLLDDYEEEKLTQAVEPGTFLLAYPFLRFAYDGRDSKLNPKYGYYIAGMVEYGLPYDEEASEYLKYELEGRAIYTFSDLTFAAVGKVGILDEMQNEVPESKRFFAGGTYSNRAYGYKRVGVIFSPTRYGIEGALTWANLSLEADYPIWGDIYGAVFTDNTMLTVNSYDFTGEILTSAGVGVRYMTPIGPIKVDVAANVQDASQYGIQFAIGQSF
ncbi:MAG: BamA/TamA family outer membrane protein [Campylobacterota bacterium]|nr:BamA/TamA family outer membrane protein [Campylobacterota bacterium]